MRAQNTRKQLFLWCEKLPEVRCTHRRDVSENLPHIETKLQQEAIVEIATNFPYWAIRKLKSKTLQNDVCSPTVYFLNL